MDGMAWMTLLNIGLRRYTLPPTQGWRQGAIKNRFWGWVIQDWGRPNAVWRHRQPPSIISDHVDQFKPQTHSSVSFPPALLPSVQHHHPAASRLSAPNLASAVTTCACSSLPSPAMPSSSPPLVWPVIRHGIAFLLSSRGSTLDHKMCPILIYEPHSAMLDAWRGVAGSPCDRNASTPTAASQTRDAGGNQAIMNRPPLRMARLERDMARIGNRHAQSSACSDPSCPRSPGPSPPAERAQRASEVSVGRTDVNASKRRLAPEHRPTALLLAHLA